MSILTVANVNATTLISKITSDTISVGSNVSLNTTTLKIGSNFVTESLINCVSGDAIFSTVNGFTVHKFTTDGTLSLT